MGKLYLGGLLGEEKLGVVPAGKKLIKTAALGLIICP